MNCLNRTESAKNIINIDNFLCTARATTEFNKEVNMISLNIFLLV